MRTIDVDAAVHEIDEHTYHYRAYSDVKRGVNIALEILFNAPTIDAVPVVHGEWIIDEIMFENSNDCTGGSDKYYVHCSNCKQNTSYYQGDAKRYCPNCGAKMDGETE